MNRTASLIAAGGIATAMVAGTLAVAVNLDSLRASTATPPPLDPITVVVDPPAGSDAEAQVIDLVPAQSPVSGYVPVPSQQAAADEEWEDGEWEDDDWEDEEWEDEGEEHEEWEDDEHEDDEHEDEEHEEYEGADDDD